MRGLMERSFFWPVRHPLPRVRAKSLGSNTHLTFPVVYLSLCAAGAQDLGFCWFWRLNDDGMGVSYEAVALIALRPVFSRWCAAVLIFPFPRLTTWLLLGILKYVHGIFARRSVTGMYAKHNNVPATVFPTFLLKASSSSKQFRLNQCHRHPIGRLHALLKMLCLCSCIHFNRKTKTTADLH